jgi:hypothetical protein
LQDLLSYGGAGNGEGRRFLILEDETDIVNTIVGPKVLDRDADVCVREPYLLIKGYGAECVESDFHQ